MTLVSTICYKHDGFVEGFMLADSQYILSEDEDVIHSFISDKITYGVSDKIDYLIGSAGCVEFIEEVEPGILKLLKSDMGLNESIKLIPPYLKKEAKKSEDKSPANFLLFARSKEELEFFRISTKKYQKINGYACVGSGEDVCNKELEDLLVDGKGAYLNLRPEEALYRIVSSANKTVDTIASVGGHYQIIHISDEMKELSKQESITASIVSRLMSDLIMPHNEGYEILEQLIYEDVSKDILFNLSMRHRPFFDFIIQNHSLQGKP